MDDICMSMEKLLQKGDRYQAPHTLRHISLKEQWYWAETQSHTVRYAVQDSVAFARLVLLFLCTLSSSLFSLQVP